MKNKHVHDYKLGKSGKVAICACGRFQHVGNFVPIVEQRVSAASPKGEHTPTPWTVGQKGSTLHIESPKAGYTVALIESCTDLVYSQDEANAAFIVRAVNSHADLLKALDKSAESIEQLCAMVNSYSTKLGLGKKVNAHDWIDLAMGRAIAKAEQV